MSITAIRNTTIVLFFVLLAANIFAFVMSMHQSQSIQTFEEKTHTLTLQNSELEESMYNINSLQYAASRAAELAFTKQAQPRYLQSIEVARRN